MSYPIHPLAKIFPEMKGKDYLDLKKSIADLGLQERIKLYTESDGVTYILDGRNRQKACDALGIELDPEKDYWEIEIDSPIEYIMAMNMYRRHLSTQQRAHIAADLANLKLGDVKSQKVDDSSNELPSKISQAEAADMMDVSVASVKRAKKIKEEDPKLHEAIKAGNIPATTGRKKKTTTKPKSDYSWQDLPLQLGLISGKSGGGRQSVKKALSEIDPDPDLFDENHQEQFKSACIKLLRKREPSLVKESDEAILKLRQGFTKAQESNYDKAIRLTMRNIDIFIQEEAEKYLDEILPKYHEDHERYKKVVNRYRGIFKWEQYKKILSCLHSDRLSEFLEDHPVLKKKYNDAFHIFKDHETVLCGVKQKLSNTLPRSVADWDKLKKKAQQERREKRAAAKAKREANA